jgi:hypothetical protein
MFAILVGSGLFGPIGMVIGVPLFAVIYSIVKHLVWQRLKKRGLPLESEQYMDMDHIDPDTHRAVPNDPEAENDEKKGPPANENGEKAPWDDDKK